MLGLLKKNSSNSNLIAMHCPCFTHLLSDLSWNMHQMSGAGALPLIAIDKKNTIVLLGYLYLRQESLFITKRNGTHYCTRRKLLRLKYYKKFSKETYKYIELQYQKFVNLLYS